MYPCTLNGSYGQTFLWRYSKVGEDFFPIFSFEVGDGSSFISRHVDWSEGELLGGIFVSFALTVNRYASFLRIVNECDEYMLRLFGHCLTGFHCDVFVDDDSLVRFLS